MKTFKKFAALLIAALLVMAMAVPAMAATITINQNPEEAGTGGAETYKLYKIFDVTKTSDVTEDVTTDSTIGDESASGFSYTISTSNPWFAKLGTVTDGTWTKADGQDWVTLTPSAGDSTKYTVKWVGASGETGAKAFAAWLLSQKGDIVEDETMTSNGTSATKEVDDGYWLITSSLGTNLVLATSNITITTKNEYPSDVKKVETASVSVGESAVYYVVVKIPANVDTTIPVIVHDQLPDELKFNNDVQVYIDNENQYTPTTPVATLKTLSYAALTENVEDVEVTGDNLQADDDFVIKLTTATLAGKTLVFKYSAELLSSALADTGYVNKEFTTYSKFTTTPSQPEVKTFDFDLKKVFEGNPEEELTATFELYETDSTTNQKASAPINFIAGGTITGKDSTYVKVDSDDGEGSPTITVKTDGDGKNLITNVRGLKAGTYYLTEKTTSEGYNLLTSDIVVTIAEDGTATITSSDLFSATDSTITVTNKSGTVLPSTGGMGTTILYTVGGILVLGAAIIMITRRRVRG